MRLATHPSLVDATLPPLIPVEAFYTSSSQAHGYRISPDGTKLLWIAALNGRPTVHFSARDGSAAGTIPSDRAIRWAYWALDSRHVTAWRDEHGDENFHMLLADTVNAKLGFRDVTPHRGATVRFQQNFHDRPFEYLLLDNRRNRSEFDLYRLNVKSGAEALVLKNPGDISRYYTDQAGTVIAVKRLLPGSNWSLEVPQGRGWRVIVTGSVEDNLWIEGHPLAGAGWAWAISNRGRDRQVAVRLDLSNGVETLVHEDPEADIDDLLEDPVTYKLLAVRSMPGHVTFKVFDPAIRPVLERLAADGPFDFKITGWTHDRTAATITVRRDTHGASSYLLDRTTGRLSLLTSPAIARYARHLSAMKPVRFQARDGLVLNGYLTMPKGAPGQALPMILRVHGGPFTRDYWGFEPDDQFFANRGYAVLRLNYRGSTGYGRAFMTAAKKQFARKMQDDLIDGVRWAIEQGIADPARIAIYGHSYGGYATLVGLTMTPEIFAAGVDVVGVADLATALRTVPAYWKNGLGRWHVYVGQVTNARDLADMAARSPINYVDRIRRPLLVVQGANDVRVLRSHSESIVAAARENGVEVDYIVFDDEGHAIRRSRNKLALARAMERFFALHLGGRAESYQYRKADAVSVTKAAEPSSTTP